MYRTFTRNWYKREAGKIVPNWNGRRNWFRIHNTEEEAREACRTWNESHNPGMLSNKMEYTSRW